MWTDVNTQILRDLWGAHSAAYIAGVIGAPSRNSVLGKAHRLGLSQKRTPKARATPFRKPRVQRFREIMPVEHHDQHVVDFFAHWEAKPVPGSCTLMDLSLDTCRWPLWGDVVSDPVLWGDAGSWLLILSSPFQEGMAPMTPQQRHAVDISERLRSPPNAVPDTGINMKNGAPVAPVAPVLRPFQPSRWKTPALTLIWEVTPYHPPNPVFIPIPPIPGPDVTPGRARPIQTIREIIAQACLAWGVEEHNLLSARQTGHLARVRHAAVAITHRLTPLSLPAIGRRFGRDHTTILYAIRKLSHHIAALNQELNDFSSPAEWVRALKARLEA